MKNRTRRVAGAVFAGMFLLVGCVNRTTEKTEQEKKEYARVTLFSDVEFWHAPEWDITEGTITSEISKRTGAVIDVIDSVGDPDRQLSLMLVNDELPDLISVTDSTARSQLVTSGKVWELEEFLKKYKPDSHLLESFPEDIRYELEKRDGGWYAYPSHMNSPDAREIWEPSDEYYVQMIEYNDNKVIIWNKKLLDELGLDVSELQEKQQVLDAFDKAKNRKTTENGEEMIPLLVDGLMYQAHTLEFLKNTFGAESIDSEGNYKDSIRQPETKEALEFLNAAMRYGYITPEQMTLPNDKIKELLAGENVLCFIGNFANTGVKASLWESSGVILSDKRTLPVYKQEIAATTGWINTFVSKDCENPKETAEFLDYMTSEEGLFQWVYGIEGEHYELNEQGFVIRPEISMTAQPGNMDQNVNVWWMFYNDAWGNSVSPPENGSESWIHGQIRIAYALNEHTQIVDGTALRELSYIYAEDTEYEQIEIAIEEWKEAQITKVILADSPEDFETEYMTLIQGLEERQIQKLDDKKNEAYQKNCREYQVYIEKVNQMRTGGSYPDEEMEK